MSEIVNNIIGHKNVCTEVVAITSSQKPMKTLLISTTSLWNCGDDFIREGLLELMQLNPYVRTLWWNRAYGITDSFANDLAVNLRAADYVLIAGTPEWIDRTYRLYLHCLRYEIPLSLVGVGLRGGIKNAWQRRLMERLATSGLVEVCTARDQVAADLLRRLGFKDVQLTLDPAFFIRPLPGQRINSILCWRDISRPNRRPWSRPGTWLKWKLGGAPVPKECVKQYDRLMKDVFSAMPDPKLVMVHDNREIDRAEALFGPDLVFYSTDYMNMLKVYATAIRYVGSRIHGAIPALVHGAPAHLIYPSGKAVTMENSIELLRRYVKDIAQIIKVDYILDGRLRLDDIGACPFPHNELSEALQHEHDKVRRRLKEAKELGTFIT